MFFFFFFLDSGASVRRCCPRMIHMRILSCFLFLFNFGCMHFGVGENHGKVKEQISRFDQLIKREWKKRKKRKRK